jgi:hypothetical protein
LFRTLRRLVGLAPADAQLSFDLDSRRAAAKSDPRPVERTHPADERFVRDLTRAHRELNLAKFEGQLSTIPIRVSRRMKSRLGHYTLRGQDRFRSEIVISRRHIRRHGWDEAIQTLLHEMVHQWQDETGQKVDHGPEFRRKSRSVGITPRAKRSVSQPG